MSNQPFGRTIFPSQARSHCNAGTHALRPSYSCSTLGPYVHLLIRDNTHPSLHRPGLAQPSPISISGNTLLLSYTQSEDPWSLLLANNILPSSGAKCPWIIPLQSSIFVFHSFSPVLCRAPLNRISTSALELHWKYILTINLPSPPILPRPAGATSHHYKLVSYQPPATSLPFRPEKIYNRCLPPFL